VRILFRLVGVVSSKGLSYQRIVASPAANSTTEMTRFQQLKDGWQAHRPSLKATLLALTGLASLFAVLSASDCSFMVAARYSYDSTHVGLFSQAMYDLSEGAAQGTSKLGCVNYSDHDDFDGMFRAGRAFAVLTPICCLIAFLFMGYALAWRPQHSTPRLWMVSKVSIVAATVCQMLVFFALGSQFMCSQHSCTLTGVGILAIMNILLLVGVSVCLCLESAPTTPWITWWNEEEHGAIEAPEYLQHVDPQVSNYIRDQQDQRQRSGTVESVKVKDSDVTEAERVRVLQQVEAPAPHTYDFEAGRCPGDAASIPESFSATHEDRKDQITASEDDNSDGDSTTVVGLQDLTTFRFILLSLFLFSWAVSVAGVSRCSFLMVGPAGEDISHFAGMGLFSRAIYYDGQVMGCVDYSSQMKDDFDPVFVAGRVFGVITAFFMTVVLILVILQVFVDRYRVEMWFLVRLLLPCATLCQLFVFFVYKTQICNSSSQVECIPGQLGIWVIINVIIMTVLSFLAFVMPPPPHPIFAATKPLNQNQEQGQDQAVAQAKEQQPLQRFLFSRTSVQKTSARRASSSIGTSVLSEEAAQHGFSLERIVKINPLKSKRRPLGSLQNPTPVPPEGAFHYNSCPSVVSSTSTLDASPASMITVSLEYSGTQKRIIKTVTHPDGSKTITTTVEELTDGSSGGSSDIGASRGKTSKPLAAPADNSSETDSSVQRDRHGRADLDYEDEEDKLIANMIRDPPGSTAAGRFSPRRAAADVESEHAVKEIVVDDSSDCDRSRDANTDGSLTVETTLEEKEYYSDTA
jgi:hypothetical protein